MIDINKKYKTRNGLEYVCYWVGEGMTHGAIINTFGTRILVAHNDQGRYSNDEDHEMDLIEVKEKKQLTGFVNAYPDGKYSHVYETRAAANTTAKENRIACIDLSQYNILYEENEGL